MPSSAPTSPTAHDLVVEAAGVLRSRRPLVRAERPLVLLLARDGELAGDLRRLLHHVQPVERRRETVEDQVVDDLAVSEPVPEARVRKEIRRVRHGLHPSGDDELVAAGTDHQVGDLERADRRCAHLVDRVGGNLLRDARPDRGLTRRRLAHAGLEDLTHDHVLDLGRLEPGPAERLADCDRAELGRRMLREAAAEAPERRAHGGDDDGLTHRPSVSTAMSWCQTRCLTPGVSLADDGTLAFVRVLVVDNYDSFTYNLVHLLEELGAEVVVRRSDEVTVEEARALEPDRLVVSPGPGRPSGAGRSVELILSLGPTTPTLGVCLGHQAIVEAFGGEVGQARSLIHGKASAISHDASGIYVGLPLRLEAGRYHSLAATLVPEALAVTARTDDGEVMGVRHRELPIEGVQFHPESILTPEGPAMLRTFLDTRRPES